MTNGEGLDRPEFDILSEMERAAIEADLADPARAQRVLLGTVVALRKEQAHAREFCSTDCRPGITHRLRRLERFTVWLMGVGAALVVGGGLALSLWGLLK